MIYVGSRDGRKRLGSGLEMAETELEEGEAFSYHDEDEDSTIDPDVSLSYIEEKLQNVLGHFQKDFEGGVSAENLGAKFGGYGSFLPTYQRSPSWSHTKSPAEGHNYASPRKTLLEDQRQNALALSSASPLARCRPAPGKPVSVSRHAEESSLKSEANKKSANSSDQRTLKVRIRVGSENLPTQKNAEIYSGLGLEVSPSSSLDDSPTTSGGQCGKFLNVPEESPTSILQIMTSYPKEILLSPLSEDLIHLTEKKKPRGKWETKPVNKTSLESSGILTNGSLSSRRNQKDLEQKKLKSSEKDDVFSTELTDKRNNIDKDNPVSLSKKEKETDIDSLVYEELVSSALRLPLLSSSEHNVADLGKDVSTSLIAPTNSSFFEKEHWDSESAQDISRVEKSGGKLSSSGKISESKKGNLVSNIAEKSHSLDQSESNVSKGRKLLTSAEPNDPSKLLDTRKMGSVSDEGLRSAHEKSSSSKRKQKVAKDELAVESSLTPKAGKISHSSSVSKNESRDLQKDNGKPLDRYKDFFGDVEFEDDDNESISGEMTSSERLKDPQLVGKRSLSEDHKEKCNGKIPEKPQPAPRPASHLAPPGNGPSSEAPIGSVPLVNEDWVSCDKCQKWRLLPLGTNPKSLPDKWLCRMLTWLPGMNRCSTPEEQTTNALRALYHPAPASVPAPVSESQSIKLNNSVGNSVGIVSVDARYPGPEQQNISVQTATNSGKKKHGSTKAANSTELDGSTHSSNSKRKNLLNSGKISNLNSEDHSPSLDASIRQSIDAVEKYNDSKKEKVSAVNSSDKGTSLKIKSKREADMEGSRSSKRIKSEELQFNDEHWASDNGETSSKAGRPSTSNNTSGNDHRRKYNKQKDLSGEAKKNIVSADGLLRSEKADDKDTGKKRNAKEEMCESDHRKEKKARVSKSGGKDTSGSKASLGEDRKSRSIKEQHNNENEDYMKSEMGFIQPSVAANSSSSKVSGSHINKTSGQEVKGSPVESVSSSPLRFPNSDKVASARKNLDGSNDRKGMVKKDEDPRVKHSSEQSKVEEKTNTDQKPQNSGKKSSHSKEKGRASGSEMDKVNIKASDSLDHDSMYEEKSKSRRNKSEEKKPNTPSKGEKFPSKKDIAGGTSSESSKGQSQKKSEDPIKSHDKKHNLQQELENEKLPKKSNQGEIHDSGKSHSLPPLARNQTETVPSHKDNGFDNGDVLKAPSQRKKAECSNSQPLRHPTPNTHRVRDVEAPSPVRRDSSSHAANNALKEATDLKHLADRLKNSGSSDSIGFYFQAALKFLHGASLLESGSNEAIKHNELMHSMHIYSSTAKLCEFCAHDYEKSKDMAAAALAYKCVEVAYMRVVYCSHASASRDRNELQNALQIVPPGESPSSSASDVDNLNHQATTEKAALPKVVGSPQVSGSHIITSRIRSGVLRVLSFAQDVNLAMEASRKSRIAFTAATSRLGETSHKEGISQLKKALDFNFQDVEGLLRLVRIAMEAINR